MNIDFIETLSRACNGKTAFLGIGNIDRGDDGAGVELARLLKEAGVENVYIGNITPERIIPVIRDGNFDSVIFMDAVDMSINAGSVSIIDSQELAQKFPPISTHKLSIGSLAMLVTDGNACRVWLLGIQPDTSHMEVMNGLSEQVTDAVCMALRGIATVIAKEQICI